MQITFDRLPDTLEEFSALCNDLTKPENTCALFLLALNLYTKDKAAGEKAIDMLRGPRPMTGIDSQFIRDRLRDKKYLPLAYFDGATPENGYGPTQPYVLNVYPDQRPQDCEEGYICLLYTSGKRIFARFAPYRGGWAIHITNDGKVPDDEITEGGGLSALRRRIENAGGIMRIKSIPNFALSALLPYGEENKW